MKQVAPRLSVAIYRAALHAYPSDFKDRYQSEILAAFSDAIVFEQRRRGRLSSWGLLGRFVVQAVQGGVSERLGRQGGSKKTNERRKAKGNTMLRSLIQDIHYALRTLRKMPGFAFTVIVVMATGIGATTTIYSVVDRVLLRDLPYPSPDEIVFFDNGAHSLPEYREWSALQSLSQMAAANSESVDLLYDGSALKVNAAAVTPSFFSVFGLASDRGRLIDDSDVAEGSGVVVLSYEFWVSRWQGDPTVIGRTVNLNERDLEIIGIAAPGFHPPEAVVGGDVAIWYPYDIDDPAILDDRGFHNLSVVGRLAPGGSIENVQTEVNTWVQNASDRLPYWYIDDSGEIKKYPILSLEDATIQSVEGTLYMLLGAVGMLLLIACANAANLLLARGAARVREIALRSALGAGRGRIIAQLITESVTLSFIGGVAGVGVAFGGVRAFKVLNPGDMPRIAEVAIDLRILFFSLAISVVTGLLFGIVPAFFGSRTNLSESLKTATTNLIGSGRSGGLKSALVSGEVAIAFVLLAGATLLFNSFVNLTRVETGFNAEDVWVMPLSLRPSYGDSEGDSAHPTVTGFGEELLRRIRSVPGVQTVAAGWVVPFSPEFAGSRCCWRTTLAPVGGDESDTASVIIQPVTEDYFSVLGIPLQRGHAFEQGETDVAILSDVVAERLFPGENPIGRSIEVRGSNLVVKGVVGDVKFVRLENDEYPEIYVPFAKFGNMIPLLNVVARTVGNTGGIAEAMRAGVLEIDPLIPLPTVVRMPVAIGDSVADKKFLGTLLALFAFIASTIAALGIYGTMLYVVNQRKRELGVRLALGASPSKLLRNVLIDGTRMTAIGLALGGILAFWLSRFMESQVYGLTPTDLKTFATSFFAMGVVALAACGHPARKAARTDPLEALRTE